MPVRTQHNQQINRVYFITFTCYKWKNLFALTNAYDTVYKWFDSILPLLVVSIKQHAAVAYAARPLREAYQQPKCGLHYYNHVVGTHISGIELNLISQVILSSVRW
jgi:hypothetical protein